MFGLMGTSMPQSYGLAPFDNSSQLGAVSGMGGGDGAGMASGFTGAGYNFDKLFDPSGGSAQAEAQNRSPFGSYGGF